MRQTDNIVINKYELKKFLIANPEMVLVSTWNQPI